MRKYIEIKRSLIVITALFLIFGLNACKVKDDLDPNNTDLNGVLHNATVAQLNNVVVGTESSMRDILSTYLDDVGVVGREIYRFSGSEPRFTTDLLGAGDAVLNNNTFYVNNPWGARYRAVKNANIIISSIANTNVPTAEQKKGYLGFAKTIKAYQLLLALNLSDKNGIRIDVADPDKLGPIVSKTEALTAIADLLNEAFTDLEGNASFAFKLSAGFKDFDSVTGFKKFNRALAARVAIYRNNFADALIYLNDSFLDLTGPLAAGVYHVYSGATGDQFNPVFLPLNSTGEIRVAQPRFRIDAEISDLRLQKIASRTSSATQKGLTGSDDLALYKSNTDPVCIIRNEELILIYAEAQVKNASNFTEAVTAINRIRIANGLSGYSGALAETDLIDEILKQRRYSLYMEGHRWIDMRRYNKLSELPTDRTDDNVWDSFPIPFSENVQ